MSFFGFDTGIPDTNDELSNEQGVSQLAQEEEDLDELNDETFNIDITDIPKGRDFDYARMASSHSDHKEKSTVSAQQPKQHSSFSTQKPLISAEDLEAQMVASKTHSIPKILTVEEIEQQLLQRMSASRYEPKVPIAEDEEAVKDKEEEEEVVEHVEQLQLDESESVEMEDNNLHLGMMTDNDKRFIAKIQLSQLSNDPGYFEDFYYRRFMAKKSGIRVPDISTIIDSVRDSEQSELGGGSDDDQDRYARLLQQVKSSQRPKISQVSFDGALGKIAVNSLSNPKQLIQVKSVRADIAENEESNDSMSLQSPVFPMKKILSSIESIFEQLIVVDSIYSEHQEKTESGSVPTPAMQYEWNRTYTEAIKSIWAEIHHISKKGRPPQPTSELLKIAPPENSLSLLLSISKGRRIIPRFVKFLPKENALILLKSVLLNFKTILLRSLEPVSMLQELEDYAQNVVFPFVPCIANAPMGYLVDCMKSLLDAKAIVPVARTKPGLLFLTLYISRSEIIKMNESQKYINEIQAWNTVIYPAIFGAFQNRFSALFPPAQILPSIVTSGTNEIPQPIPVDDTYVWQFLAAMAAGSNIDQQRILVTEVRDKIFEVAQKNPQKVNIFLNVLGLDTSQLQ